MFDSEQLATMAAKAVSTFLTKGASLTDAVVSVSQSNGLNLEQTKRLTEATNQVAYLKVLETAKDRSFTFPVAEYGDVVNRISKPEAGMDKAASIYEGAGSLAPLACIFGIPEGLTKSASINDLEDSEANLVPYLASIVYGHKATLESIGFEKVACAEAMLPLVDYLRSDSLSAQKAYARGGDNLDSILGLIEKSAEEKVPGYNFKEFDLKKVAELDAKLSRYVELEKLATQLNDELEKISFMAISGRIAGSIFGKNATGMAKAPIQKLVSSGDLMAKNPINGRGQSVVRGYQGYPGQMAKSAAAASGNGLPPAGPTPAPGAKPSFSQNFSDKFKKGLIYKALPKNLTWGQRVDRVGTVADYAFMREAIAPKHSVWDSLHNKGDSQ